MSKDLGWANNYQKDRKFKFSNKLNELSEILSQRSFVKQGGSRELDTET